METWHAFLLCFLPYWYYISVLGEEYRLITPVEKNIVGKLKHTNQLFCTQYSSQHDTFLP